MTDTNYEDACSCRIETTAIEAEEKHDYLIVLAKQLGAHYGISPYHWHGRNVLRSLQEVELDGGVNVFWGMVEQLVDDATCFPHDIPVVSGIGRRLER